MKRRLCIIISAALVLALLFSVFAYAGSAAADYIFPRAARPEPGDANYDGELTSEDARIALRCSVGLEKPLWGYWSYYRQPVADLTGDGTVTAEDARSILRCSVGLDGYEPPQADDGYYCMRAGLHSDYRAPETLNALNSLVCAVPTDYPEHTFPLWRIDSAETLESWLNAFGQDSPDRAVTAFLHRYGDAFFEEYDLFICYQVESSGSYIPAAYRPVFSEGTLTFTFARAYPENGFGTDDMADWLQFVPVKKSVSQKAAAFACVRGEDIPLELEQYRELGKYQ